MHTPKHIQPLHLLASSILHTCSLPSKKGYHTETTPIAFPVDRLQPASIEHVFLQTFSQETGRPRHCEFISYHIDRAGQLKAHGITPLLAIIERRWPSLCLFPEHLLFRQIATSTTRLGRPGRDPRLPEVLASHLEPVI